MRKLTRLGAMALVVGLAVTGLAPAAHASNPQPNQCRQQSNAPHNKGTIVQISCPLLLSDGTIIDLTLNNVNISGINNLVIDVDVLNSLSVTLVSVVVNLTNQFGNICKDDGDGSQTGKCLNFTVIANDLIDVSKSFIDVNLVNVLKFDSGCAKHGKKSYCK